MTISEIRLDSAHHEKTPGESAQGLRGDSGLLHALLGIPDQQQLELHPKIGASWEGYAVEEVLKALRPDDAYFWATHQGAELDMLLFKHGKRIGLECKRVDAPVMTASMRIALEDLKLDRLVVVYPAGIRYPLSEKVEAIPLSELVIEKSDYLWKKPRRSRK